MEAYYEVFNIYLDFLSSIDGYRSLPVAALEMEKERRRMHGAIDYMFFAGRIDQAGADRLLEDINRIHNHHYRRISETLAGNPSGSPPENPAGALPGGR